MGRAEALWRGAGMNFLDYLSITSKHLRSCVKESARPNYAGRDIVYFKRMTYENGSPTAEKEVIHTTAENLMDMPLKVPTISNKASK